jgi:hypothetical protein
MDYFNQLRHDISPFKSFADAIEKCEPLIYINLDKVDKKSFENYIKTINDISWCLAVAKILKLNLVKRNSLRLEKIAKTANILIISKSQSAILVNAKSEKIYKKIASSEEEIYNIIESISSIKEKIACKIQRKNSVYDFLPNREVAKKNCFTYPSELSYATILQNTRTDIIPFVSFEDAFNKSLKAVIYIRSMPDFLDSNSLVELNKYRNMANDILKCIKVARNLKKNHNLSKFEYIFASRNIVRVIKKLNNVLKQLTESIEIKKPISAMVLQGELSNYDLHRGL